MMQGCTITQANKPLAIGTALISNTQMSSLTAVATTALLTSPELPNLLVLNSKRLAHAYARLASLLKDRNIPYIPANSSPFLFAKLVPNAQTWDEEAEVIRRLALKGVSVSAGRSYHGPEKEKGWIRLNFALPADELPNALEKLAAGLDHPSRKTGAEGNTVGCS
jgi:gliotoxin/aspirochlorine biosynthesis aminotransferase